MSGRVGAVVTANGAPVASEVMVTARTAVAVTVANPRCPTGTLPKAVCGSFRAAVTGWPKPYSRPSRVPT